MSRRDVSITPGGHAQPGSLPFNPPETVATYRTSAPLPARARDTRRERPGPRTGTGTRTRIEQRTEEGSIRAVAPTTAATTNPFTSVPSRTTSTSPVVASWPSSTTIPTAVRSPASSSSGRRLVRDINASLQSMKRLYRGRDDVPDDDLQDVADEDENGDEDEECRSGGHAVISTIDDPSMEEEITEDVESDPVHTILLDETVDTNMHQHRKRKQEEVQDSAGEMFVASLGNSSHPKVSMDIKDHQDQDDPGSASVAHRPMVLPSAFAQRQQPRASVTSTQGSSLFSSTLSSSSSSSSPPVSVPPHPATSLLASPQTSSTFRLGHQHSVDTHRPRWTEAGRRAVEELRGISREGEDESQGQVIKDEETSQTRRAQNEGESTGMVNVQDHTVVEEGNSGGGGSGGTRNEEAEDVLWSIRDRKRPKFLHHDRSSYLRGPGRKQASTASTAGAGAGVGAGGPSVEKAPSAKASKANNEQPRLLWLRDIQQNLREERTAPPRLPSVTAYTAAIGSLNMEMDPMGGYYPSAGAVLKDMLSWLKDTPLTSPRELESRTWMLDSPVVLKPERIQ